MRSGHSHPPTLYVLAGPNGAGKSSAAAHLLGTRIPLDRYVNPDDIAAAIGPDDPYAARWQAGVRALGRIRFFERARLDFGLETTLSGGWTTRLVRRLLASGYAVDLTYLWLPDADAAVARVRFRFERQGGHFVPEDDVRRRFRRSLVNFDGLRGVVTRWRLIDTRGVRSPLPVAEGTADDIEILDDTVWREVIASIRAAGSGARNDERGGDE